MAMVGEREEGETRARRDLVMAGCSQRDQGDTRADATDNTHASSTEHCLRGRSAINGKAMVRGIEEGASPRAHSEETSNNMA